MNLRERFVDYVKNGGKPICSPQIGAGAGFDAKVVGKEWLHETTLDDTLSVVGMLDIVPLVNVGLPEMGYCNPSIAWKTIYTSDDGDKRYSEAVIETPVGTLHQKVTSEKIKGGFRNQSPVNTVEDLDVLEYYIDTALDSDLSRMAEFTAGIVDKIDGRAALDVQWAMQPYEMFCFPDTVTTVMLAMDAGDRFVGLMDKILELDKKLIDQVKAGGADFVFLGGPAAEMISPRYYEEFIIPYSKLVTDYARSTGLLIYSHICSPIEPFLSMGFFNRMGIDLFETLSPPPVGNVKSMADAMTKIDPAICTRGNVGLDVLLNETPEVVRERVFEIMDATRGRKHIVAASDYIFYDVPFENVKAMADAVNEYNATHD